MNAIELRELDFSFGKENILKGITLNIPKASIYGFLGPNGAGKSTTIRILMNLYSAPFEQVKLFGKTYKNNRKEILSKIGAMIESPPLYEHLTAYQNLDITRKILQLNESEIAQVLAVVKLSNVTHKKVEEFSLGMKQRLGIALALLGDREVLLLDEPINGLDPKGIIEIRELLRNLNTEHGKTIFISSHILSEVDRLVSDLAVINNGEVLFDGKIEAFRELGRPVFKLSTSNNDKAAQILENCSPYINHDGILELNISDAHKIATIIRQLVENSVDVYTAFKDEKSLEEIFLTMTEGEE